MLDIREIIGESRSEIDAEMQAVLETKELPIYNAVRYALGWVDEDGKAIVDGGGKGLRPALCLIAASAIDSSRTAHNYALAGAAAMEFVHNYSLVHDDIQDQDKERHHRPTVWVQWGSPQAINVGDALRELAQIALHRAHNAGADDSTVLDSYELLNRASLEMIEGQYLDLAYEQKSDIDPGDYLAMIEKKTGAIIGCSMGLGALLAGGTANVVSRLEQAGRQLGLCFQIRDDLLGIWGNTALTGKSTNNDIRRKKKSFPIVYAFCNATAKEQEKLKAIYSHNKIDQEDIDAVMEILANVKAQEATNEAAKEHFNSFHRELENCSIKKKAGVKLDSIANFVLTREH